MTKFVWNEENRALCKLRISEGVPYGRIAQEIGCSLTTVYGVAGQYVRKKKGQIKRGWEPLPAGHAVTWGAISDRPWPGA